jgi:hypothetical protein
MLTGGRFDASVTCLCGQVFLGEGHLPYRPSEEDALSERKYFSANGLTLSMRKHFRAGKMAKHCRLKSRRTG